MGPNAVPPNQQGVPQVVVTGGPGAQAIPAASIMGGYAGLTAQQLTALAAASAGAVIPNIPGIPGALRFPLPTPSITDLMLAQGLLFPGATVASAGTAQPQAATDFSGYRDYSNGPDSMTISIAPAKDHSFPMKLHRILSDPENSEYIAWLPHGRSWRVLKPKAFEDKVIPKYFRHAKYASFMRQVNGWGFKRMTQGPDHNSYYHEVNINDRKHMSCCFSHSDKKSCLVIYLTAIPEGHSQAVPKDEEALQNRPCSDCYRCPSRLLRHESICALTSCSIDESSVHFYKQRLFWK